MYSIWFYIRVASPDQADWMAFVHVSILYAHESPRLVLSGTVLFKIIAETSFVGKMTSNAEE